MKYVSIRPHFSNVNTILMSFSGELKEYNYYGIILVNSKMKRILTNGYCNFHVQGDKKLSRNPQCLINIHLFAYAHITMQISITVKSHT